MTAEPPENPVIEAVRSLEVRWIFAGQLETAVAGWFGRFLAAVECLPRCCLEQGDWVGAGCGRYAWLP